LLHGDKEGIQINMENTVHHGSNYRLAMES